PFISNFWYMNFYPPGCFVNLINQPYMTMSSHQFVENFHFVGLTRNLNTSPPPLPSAKRTPKPSRLGKETIDIDANGDTDSEETKAVKKRYWRNFWKEITEYFNKHAPSDRQRDDNQLKIHYSRLKTLTSNFNWCWIAVSKMHTSGYSDDQLMDEAQKMYANANNGKPFTLVHWWKTLKKEPKFSQHEISILQLNVAQEQKQAKLLE
ncbi:hypothetical protein ACJX0J_037220, partial [Zea mays]